MSNAQNAKLSNALENKGTVKRSQFEMFEEQMREWWKGSGKKVASLCGSDEMARRLFVTAINVVQRTPKIVECEFSSFINCLLQSAELDLFPGAKQEVGYVPKQIKGVWQVQFWPMYFGHIKHMYQTRMIDSISCNVVHEQDEFDFQEGSKPFVHFKRSLKDRGEPIAAYCSIDLIDAGRIVEVMSMDDLQKVKNSSPNKDSDYSPWVKWPEGMQRKTVLKRAQKWAPKSDRLAQIIQLDNEAERPDLAKPKIINLSGLTDMVQGAAEAAKKQTTQSPGQLPEPPLSMDIPVGTGTQPELLSMPQTISAQKSVGQQMRERDSQ